MRSLDYLLDNSGHKATCSEFSRSINNDPCGTAIHTSKIIVIDVHLPWPNKILDHKLFTGFEKLVNHSFFSRTKILFRVPQNPDELKISIFQKQTPTVETSISYERTSDIKNILTDICEGHSTNTLAKKNITHPIVLVCCHGTRDTCCGSAGTKLANELLQQTKFSIQKVSHLGGHRFAPTILTLPNGRMWAYLSTQNTINIINKDIKVKKIISKYRGWWGASSNDQQISEKELFADVGWDLDKNPPTSIEEQILNQDQKLFTLQTKYKKADVEVTRIKNTPIVECKKQNGGNIKYQRTFKSKLISIRDI